MPMPTGSATRAISVGDYYTTPVLFDTTTYYLEEHYQDDTLLCVSPRVAVTVYVLDNTAVSEYEEDSELKVSPNPTGDYLRVETGDVAICAVSVYDARGKLVLTKRVSVPAVLDVTALKPGNYFLRVEYADGQWRGAKFVKTGGK